MKVTVVTPSYNQGRFLEQTIRSVLSQGYANLEYLILDGGSTDNSLAIIQRYAFHLAYWCSAPDGGQAVAVNEGFRKATGELIGWQNSDDYYYPGAIQAAVDAAEQYPDVDLFYGDKDYVDISGKYLLTAWAKDPHDFSNMIPWPCVNTEVLFFRRRLIDEGFRLNEQRRHYMDYEFFWDLLLAGKKFMHVPGIRAAFRQHSEAKSSTQGAVAQAEAFEIYCKVWKSGKLDEPAKAKLLQAMQDECRNDFSAGRFELFDIHLRGLRDASGEVCLPGDLRFRSAVSQLPAPLPHLALQANRFMTWVRKLAAANRLI